MRQIVIIGAGGFAREVLDVIDAINQNENKFEVLGYIVDPEYASPGSIVNDLPVLGGFDWLSSRSKDVLVICGVGSPHYRYQLVRRASAVGCSYISLIHPSATLTRWIHCGEGVVITAGCILTNQILIGNHVIINLDCTIGHDVVVEDFVTLSPGTHVSGNVTLREGATVGTGANIIEKIEIGAWSTIGAGSVVVRDVPANTTVVGVSAKVIKEREQGWHLS